MLLKRLRDTMARAESIEDPLGEVVRLVAVVPTRAELWLLGQTVGPSPAAVEACLDAGLLVETLETATIE